MDKILQQFLEVASLQNVSHAAKKLFLSQPTLTHNMKKLEESLGVQLFVRTSNGIRLTEFGEVLRDHARVMQRVYDSTLLKIEQLKARHERELKIGTGHAWWFLFLSDTICDYRQVHPGANIHIDVGNHLRLMALLLSGDLDLFVGHEIIGLNKRAGVSFIPLFLTQDWVYVRKEHPLATRVCSNQDLENYPIIEVTPDEHRHQFVVEDLQPKKLEREQLKLTEKILYRSNSLFTCMDIANRSNGILLFPKHMAAYFKRFNLVNLQMSEEYQRKGNVGIYLIRERQHDLHIQDIQEIIRRNVDKIGANVE